MKRSIAIILFLCSFGVHAQQFEWEKQIKNSPQTRFGSNISIEKIAANEYAVVGENYYSYRWAYLSNIDTDSSGITFYSGLQEYAMYIYFFDENGDSLNLICYEDSIYAGTYQLKKDLNQNIVVSGIGYDYDSYDSTITGVSPINQAIYLIKLDLDGKIIWHKKYNFPYTFQVPTGELLNMYDGGYLVSGYLCDATVSECSAFALRVDADGNEIWKKGFTSLKSESSADLHYLKDGSLLSLGGSSMDVSDIFLLNFDVNGNIIYEKSVNVPIISDSNKIMFSLTCALTPTGDFVCFGQTGQKQSYIAKFDYNFNYLGGVYVNNKKFLDVKILENQTMLFSGYGADTRAIVSLYNINTLNHIVTTSSPSSGIQQRVLYDSFLEDDGTLMAVGSWYSDSYYSKYTGFSKPFDVQSYYCSVAAPFSNFTATVSGSTISFTETSYAALQYNQELYYEWYFEDGQESNLKTPSIIFDKAKYPTSFWAALVVTNGVLCKDTITKNVYTNEILPNPTLLAVEEVPSVPLFQSNLLVYPNPATHELTVQLPLNIEKNAQLSIFNAVGQEFCKLPILSHTDVKINVSAYPKGIYFVVLQSESQTWSSKVVVE